MLYLIGKENFVPEGTVDKVHFRCDGKPFAVTRTRYFMEHAGSKGKVSSGQMCDFIKHISNNDLGMIHRYKKGKMSRRMLVLCKSISKHWQHMIQDIPGEFCDKQICLLSIGICAHEAFMQMQNNYVEVPKESRVG